jgi:hypothetical protein
LNTLFLHCSERLLRAVAEKKLVLVDYEHAFFAALENWRDMTDEEWCTVGSERVQLMDELRKNGFAIAFEPHAEEGSPVA